MKSFRMLAAAAVLFICTSAWSEETAAVQKTEKKDTPPEVLFNLSETTLSGYGALYTRISKAGDATGCFVGGRGGFILNDSYVIGAGGMGLAHPTDREELTGNNYSGLFDTVEFGYGGLLTEYYINPKDLIVFSFGTLIGGGGLSFDNADDDEDEDNNHNGDSFFVVEPEINVFIHLTRFCRLGAGISYRYVNGIDSESFNDSDFRGPAASAMIQLGWF